MGVADVALSPGRGNKVERAAVGEHGDLGARAQLAQGLEGGRRAGVQDGFVFADIRGVAAALVKAAYDYALSEGLTPVATCAYAVAWLQRHPEYKGCSSAEYAQGNSCAL